MQGVDFMSEAVEGTALHGLMGVLVCAKRCKLERASYELRGNVYFIIMYIGVVKSP